MTRKAARDTTTIPRVAGAANKESGRSGHGKDGREEDGEQKVEQEEEWRANGVYGSNDHHSNYFKRKRCAPRTDLSKLTAEEQRR